MKKRTFGLFVATSALPFMTGKHTLSPDECINIIQKPIDRKLKEKDEAIHALLTMLELGKVLYQGITYTKGFNEYSFQEAIRSKLETNEDK